MRTCLRAAAVQSVPGTRDESASSIFRATRACRSWCLRTATVPVIVVIFASSLAGITKDTRNPETNHARRVTSRHNRCNRRRNCSFTRASDISEPK